MKIFFSDIDGTFVQNQQIPPENLEAVRKIEAAGHRFVFVTGRGEMDTQRTLADGNFDCDYIFGNGAGYKLMGETPVLQHIIPRSDYDRFEEILKGNNAFYYIHTNEGIVMQHMDQIMHHFDYLGEVYRERFGEDRVEMWENRKIHFRERAHFVDDPFAYLRENEHVKAIKFELLNGEDDIRERVAAEATAEGYFAFNSVLINLEVVPPNTTKANGIKEYLRLFPDAEITYGFGDAMNDYDMYEVVDVGVAVANAFDAIKEIADVVLEGEEMGSYILRELL